MTTKPKPHSFGWQYEFENQYGIYPSEETAELVKKKHPSSINLSGNSSNSLFRQPFASGIVENDAMFYTNAPGFISTRTAKRTSAAISSSPPRTRSGMEKNPTSATPWSADFGRRDICPPAG